MKILRKNMSNIIKKDFSDDMFVNYSEEQLLFIEESLRNVIENYPISTIDCITYLRKHYSGDLKDALNSITDAEAQCIRFNCIYQSEVLKEILENHGIYGYQVSYKAINFTTDYSDKLIKESHTSIFVPAIVDNKKCFIILEPGLKIDKPIYFFGCEYDNEYDNLKISIGKTNDKEYPFYLLLDGINKYSYNQYPHKVYQEFNPNYYTIDPIKLLIPHIYLYLYGYRATNFSLDVEKRTSLTIFPIDKKIVIYHDKTKEIIQYNFDEIDNNLLAKILPTVCNNLDLDLDETIKDILFMREINSQFIQMMDDDTVKTYLKKNNH